MQQTPITLTAAELYVLRDLENSTGREAFKTTLTELLARGVIRFHRETKQVLWIFPKQENYLALVPNMRSRASSKQHVAAVLDVVSKAQEQPFGAWMENVIRDAWRGPFGKTLVSDKSDFVLPSLAREGLVAAQQEKTLGLFKRTKFVLTPKGQETLKQFYNLTARAESLPEMAKQNPTEAIALMALLGSGFILMPEMRGHYQEIGASVKDARQRGSDGGSADGGGDGLGGDGNLEFSDLAAQFEAGYAGLLDSFEGVADSFDSVMDSFDSGFDASDSGDGGGDGGDGGGDGGGGGD